MRKGRVLFKDIPAGIIEETDDGYRFTYDSQFLKSERAHQVSVTLPLREEPYDSKILHPFFDGLIPEGWLLSVVVKNWKLNEKDRMGLLLTVCKDCIGAVSVEGYDE
jgi:serine/threonine-protein kinase HipA